MSALTALVGIAVVGLLLLGLMAVLLGVLDSAQSGAWRRIAAERRATWERRQYRHRRATYVDSWGDQDDA